MTRSSTTSSAIGADQRRGSVGYSDRVHLRLRGWPFTEDTVKRMLTSEPMASPGACILARSWQLRDQILNRQCGIAADPLNCSGSAYRFSNACAIHRSPQEQGAGGERGWPFRQKVPMSRHHNTQETQVACTVTPREGDGGGPCPELAGGRAPTKCYLPVLHDVHLTFHFSSSGRQREPLGFLTRFAAEALRYMPRDLQVFRP